MENALTVIFAYFLGNLSPGLWLTRVLGHGDVRVQGSGGTGATNTARVLGKKWFGVVLALDMLKAAVAVSLPCLLAAMTSGTVPADKLLVRALACGLSVVAGHVWPALLDFKGGKGVGPFLGVWLAIGFVAWPSFWFVPLTLLTPIAFGFLLLPLKKGAFLSALCALPTQVGVFWYLTGNTKAVLPALAIVVVVMFAHRENFRRKKGVGVAAGVDAGAA
jgi:glycerol-3-phosphate acyltransferase PlsY